MLSQETINMANQLPPSAQKVVADLVYSLANYNQEKQSINNTDTIVKKGTDSFDSDKPIKKQFKHGKEAGFGLFTTDVEITDEKIEQAIADGASEGIRNVHVDEDGFYAYVDAPERQETVQDTFGIIKTNRKLSLDDMHN